MGAEVQPNDDADNKRRSSRVFIRVPVRAAGKNNNGRHFKEVSETILVNAHGCLFYLNETLEMGSELVITNPVTEEDQECRIVFLGDVSKKGQRVGVEFLSPAPHFWGIEFAQPDWPPRSSGEAVQ